MKKLRNDIFNCLKKLLLGVEIKINVFSYAEFSKFLSLDIIIKQMKKLRNNV